jgi:hypothetical protein
LEPKEWLRFAVEAADARSRGFSDPADLRVGYVEFGRAETVRVRAGRQEISLGDESLVGADNEWCNLGRSFDAVSVEAAGVRVFSGRMVEPSASRMNRPSASDQLSGIYYEGRRGQPFALWTHGSEANPRSLFTAGTYLAAGLPHGAEANITIAAQ